MADEFPNPEDEFDFICQADYEALRELEELETLTQPGPSGVSQTANRNKNQAKTPISVNLGKVIDNDASSSNKKRSYEDLHHTNVSVRNKKRNCEELLDDISNLLGTNRINVSADANRNKDQAKTSISVNFNKVIDNEVSSSNKKHSYEDLYHTIPGSSKKRNYEELFGDISDLLGTNASVDVDLVEEPKEKKLRWDQPEDVIQKILDARQLLHEHDGDALRKTKCDDNKKNSISTRVPSWNFVAITRLYDSQRLYIRVRNRQNDIKQTKRPITNLLSISYEQLKAQAQKIMSTKNELSIQPLSNLCDTNNIINDELWVDKYRPRSYLELLSDETVNRQLLYWLKLWDKIVFNRNIIKQKKQLSVFGKKKDIDEKTDVEEVDNRGYPIKRIALLSGPPGLGKTTLAHIAARHAGYNIVEINASDERSPDTFRQILLASTEMKAVIGADPRPNCLIFDEIDGAPAASIELLLKFIQGKLISKNKKSKGQSEKTSDGCIRPVVCICNEPYAPTLRTLRAAAVIIPVPEVSPLRLAERLMEIAKKEKLNVDFGDLVKIAERSGCDVRACVGALQYMGSANLKDNISLGLKDTRKNLFDSWKSILTIPINKGGVIAIPERIQNILRTVQNGESEKLAQGIFHNYPEICDKKLDNVATSLEWFQFYDLITSLVTHKQVWLLMPYTNYGFVAWHLNFARTQKVKLSYPTIINEVIQKSARNIGILTAVRRVCGRDAFTLITDVAGFLPALLAPKLRIVPSHLYSSKEKADLVKIINVMLDFGLSFVQEKNPQGGYIYNLDPNILEVGVLPNCNPHRYLAYAVQQIIAQELEVERLKRASILTGIGGVSLLENTTKSEKSENTKNNKDNKDNSSNNKDNSSLTSTKSEKNATSLKEVVYKDFFGNIITNKNENKMTNRISPKSQKGYSLMQNILTKHGIWYKYKEGCNNAVRRSVFMEKLL